MSRTYTDFSQPSKGKRKRPRTCLRSWPCLFLAAAGTVASAKAEVVSGAEYWTIENGDIPHIVYNNNRSVDFAVDKWGEAGWEVVVHHTQGMGYIAAGAVDETVNDRTFINDPYAVEGTGDVFRMAFRWWSAQNAGDTSYLYGWVTLGTKDGNLVIVAGEVADAPDVAVVGRGDPSVGDDPEGGDDEEDHLVFDWIVIDRGEYIELGEQGPPSSGASGKVVIPSEIGGKSVCSIGEAAFYFHGEITQVVIPETVSNIGYKAFNRCMALERCNIPSGVTNIDEVAFAQTALREISLPDSVKEIKGWTFNNCESLSNAVLGAGVTNIGEMAFCQTALTNVTIGAQVEYIDFAAFQGCNMKSVSIWPWTRLGVQPFDLSCRIEYTGAITNFTGFARDCGEEVTNLMAWVGRENFIGVMEFKVCDDYGERYGTEFWYSKLLFNIGMSPVVTQRQGSILEAKYIKPTMEVVAFDPVLRTITGRVVPQGGCCISGVPSVLWPLGLRVYGNLDSEGGNILDNAPDVSKFADDKTLGEFMHTIPEKDFATNRFFRVELIDW